MVNGRATLFVAAALFYGVTANLNLLVAQPDLLSAEEAEALLAGNTLVGFTPKDQSKYKTFYSTSGQIRAKIETKTERTDAIGRWWVTADGKVCNEWETFGFVNACHAIRKDGNSIAFIDDSGRVVSFAEHHLGNEEFL